MSTIRETIVEKKKEEQQKSDLIIEEERSIGSINYWDTVKFLSHGFGPFGVIIFLLMNAVTTGL